VLTIFQYGENIRSEANQFILEESFSG